MNKHLEQVSDTIYNIVDKHETDMNAIMRAYELVKYYSENDDEYYFAAAVNFLTICKKNNIDTVIVGDNIIEPSDVVELSKGKSVEDVLGIVKRTINKDLVDKVGVMALISLAVYMNGHPFKPNLALEYRATDAIASNFGTLKDDIAKFWNKYNYSRRAMTNNISMDVSLVRRESLEIYDRLLLELLVNPDRVSKIITITDDINSFYVSTEFLPSIEKDTTLRTHYPDVKAEYTKANSGWSADKPLTGDESGPNGELNTFLELYIHDDIKDVISIERDEYSNIIRVEMP